MNAVDTNVLVYAIDPTEPVKQAKAVALLAQLTTPPVDTILTWQAAAEYLCCLRRWQSQGRILATDVTVGLNATLALFPLVLPRAAVLQRSLDLSSRYSLSHWDSMLLAACLEANVDTLYSEDFSNGATYDSVKVVNPVL
jgi:predicted nucleic acid-binding protein